jgi:hypothetical protein
MIPVARKHAAGQLWLASASFPVRGPYGFPEPLFGKGPKRLLAITNVSSGVLLVPLRRQETLGWLAGLTSFRRDPACGLPGSSPLYPLTVMIDVAIDRAAGQLAVGFGQFPRWQR